MTSESASEPLMLGNPPDWAESNFTLFVLPFRYSLRPSDAPQPAAVFEEECLDLQADEVVPRVRYLTGETRGIMFGQQAGGSLFSAVLREIRSYRLQPDCRLRWHAKGATEPIELPVTVRVVLFDRLSAERSDLATHQSCGCIGFLIVRVAMVAGMRFVDLLDLNTNFRLVHYQWACQAEQLKGDPAQLRWEERRATGHARPRWTRFPAFDLWVPDGTPPPAPDEHWQVRFWRRLLDYPVHEGNQTFAIVPDIDAYPDDRAYIVSHACVDGLDWQIDADGLPQMDSRLAVAWHQFLYVEDTEAPWRGTLSRFEYDWAKERTYRRWGLDLRLYGFTNYSFCSLCVPRTFALPVVHFEQMYLDQLLLVLYQRVAVFAFGRELTALSQVWKAKDWSAVQRPLRELRAAFGQFVNLYWFPAFTNQVQGLEMYEIARKELNNLELFDELRQEMEQTWGFMQARNAEALNHGVTVVALVGLMLGFLGMSLVTDQGALHLPGLGLWVALAVFLLVLWLAFRSAVADWGAARDEFARMIAWVLKTGEWRSRLRSVKTQARWICRRVKALRGRRET